MIAHVAKYAFTKRNRVQFSNWTSPRQESADLQFFDKRKIRLKIIIRGIIYTGLRNEYIITRNIPNIYIYTCICEIN